MENQFSLGKMDETGAVDILVKGDAMGVNYKIREPCQVSRVMGRMVIDTHESLDTGVIWQRATMLVIRRQMKPPKS